MNSFCVMAKGEFIGKHYPKKYEKNDAEQFILCDFVDSQTAHHTFENAKIYFETVYLFKTTRSKILGKLVKYHVDGIK